LAPHGVDIWCKPCELPVTTSVALWHSA
jgi:hypothetical protein